MCVCVCAPLSLSRSLPRLACLSCRFCQQPRPARAVETNAWRNDGRRRSSFKTPATFKRGGIRRRLAQLGVIRRSLVVVGCSSLSGVLVFSRTVLSQRRRLTQSKPDPTLDHPPQSFLPPLRSQPFRGLCLVVVSVGALPAGVLRNKKGQNTSSFKRTKRVHYPFTDKMRP